jgi:hypothetical protein
LPLLLLLPLALVFFLLLWALLLPVALWQRYRLGQARRSMLPWLIGLNAWLLVLSAAVFVCSAWVAGFWVESALTFALGGLTAGLAAGVAGLALTRFEHEGGVRFYTANRWIVLVLTLIVAARIGYGVWRAWQAWQAGSSASWLAQQGSVMAVGGLLLGYYLAYGWGLRRRLRRP